MVKKRKITSISKISKKTKINRQDRIDKFADNIFWNLKSVKCTLNPFCSDDRIKESLRNCAHWLSKLTIHSHHVMTLLLARKNGDVTVDYGMWNKVYRATLRALKGKSKISEEDDVAKAYVEKCGVTKWPHDTLSGWMNKPLEEAARMSAVGYKTHLQTNLLVYIKRYLRLLIETDDRFQSIDELPEKKKNAVFSCVCASFTDSLPVGRIVERRPSVQKLGIEEPVWEAAIELVNVISLLAPRGETTLRAISKTFYTILSELEPYAARLQAKVLDDDEDDQPTTATRKKRGWTFALCPQHRWRPKYIRLSNTGLQMLLDHLNKTSNDQGFIARYKRAMAEAGLHADTWSRNYVFWNEFFNLDKVLRRKDIDDPTSRRMSDSIMTDGVGVSVSIQVLKSEGELRLYDMKNELKKVVACIKTEATEELKSKKKELEKDVKEFQDALTKKTTKRVADMVRGKCKVVALDPGKSNVGTWVIHNDGETRDDGKYENGTLFGGEWRFLSGQTQFTKKMNVRAERFCPGVKNQPTTKTVSASKLVDSYKYQIDHGGSTERAYFDSTMWFQKQKMKKYVKTQKALETVVEKVLGVKNKKTQRGIIVAYGDGDMSSNMRGVSPLLSTAFYKKMKSSATVQLVSEFRTSKLCSCCEHELTKGDSFRVLRCNNSQCIRTFWNRDINAAINILKLFLHSCSTGTRLPKFSRQAGVDE